jgi:hypothetical protein
LKNGTLSLTEGGPVFLKFSGMKRFFLFLFFVLQLGISGFSQKASQVRLIYLTDGSFLRGTLLDTLENEAVVIQLSEGTRLELPLSLLWQVRQSNEEDLLLSDGRRVLEKGFYSSFSVHTLSARRSSNQDENLRWGLGGHFTAGHQFDPLLKVGLGIGLDAHEYFFVPLFAEAGGFFVKRSLRPKTRKSPNNIEWFDGRKISIRRKFPLCYNFQVGYNLPAAKLFNNENSFEKIRGGFMFYPSLGVMVPSRNRATFRLDVGYKFQRYKRIYESNWWWNWESSDKVSLKSFAMRVGWYF